MKPIDGNGTRPSAPITDGTLSDPKEAVLPPQLAKKLPYVPPQKQEPSWKDHLKVLAAGAFIVILLLVFALNSVSRRKVSQPAVKKGATQAPATVDQGSAIPLLEAAPLAEQRSPNNIQPDEIAKTARPKPQAEQVRPRSIGEVPPFQGAASWQPPPYQDGNSPTAMPVKDSGGADAKAQQDLFGRASLIFTRGASPHSEVPRSSTSHDMSVLSPAAHLPPGTRLRARLEAAVSTAVATPVIAIIEYNYEQDGAIAIPAGSRAFGHLEAADRSGLLSLRFDSLTLPDGTDLPLQAVGTDLSLRPLKGKVEGRNARKNLLVRSVSGVGQVAATLLGRGSLNQPLSEGDLLRERVSNNIGEASDQEVSRLAITERLVISLPADREIYVVLQKPAAPSMRPSPAAEVHSDVDREKIDELRQLLRLQREMKQQTSASAPEQ